MDDVQREVLLEIFAGPSKLIPAVIGVTATILGWGASSGLLAALGGIALLVAIGICVTDLIFNLEKITEKAFNILQDAEKKKEETGLDALNEKLVKDKDSRTQVSLQDLRTLHKAFFEKLDNNKVNAANRDIPEQIEALFRVCIKQLERSYELYEDAKRLRGDGRRLLEQERENIVREVRQSVEDLSGHVARFKSLHDVRDEGALTGIREELNRSMRAKLEAEQEVGRIGKPAYDESEFE